MFSKKIFSARLIELRAEHKVSSQILAEGIGVSRPAISRFEHGVDFPHVNTLVALADYFNVSLDYLAGRSDDPQRH